MDLKRLTGKLTAWILVIQLLWIPVQSGLQVLCVGADGHVALEMGTGSLCQEDEAEEPSHEVLESGVHCGPCKDFLLGETRLCPGSREATLDVPDRAVTVPGDTAPPVFSVVIRPVSDECALATLARLAPVQLLC